MHGRFISIAILFLAAGALGAGRDIEQLLRDRTAIERVYYNHRLGEKPAFEKVSPPSLIERLVKDDLRKESTLKKVYGVEISSAQLDAEVNRINTTTRAPEILAELKSALGGDRARFARTVAKPILVERVLRDRFDNDDQLHSPQRRQVEAARAQLLTAKNSGASSDKLLAVFKAAGSNQVSESTWLLGARTNVLASSATTDQLEIKKRFGPNAQLLTPSPPDADRKFYFEDLPGDLQQVLRVQLRQAGDVSAVIEMPSGFTLYVAKEKTSEKLSAAVLSVPKRSYEQWLEEQGGDVK